MRKCAQPFLDSFISWAVCVKWVFWISFRFRFDMIEFHYPFSMRMIRIIPKQLRKFLTYSLANVALRCQKTKSCICRMKFCRESISERVLSICYVLQPLLQPQLKTVNWPKSGLFITSNWPNRSLGLLRATDSTHLTIKCMSTTHIHGPTRNPFLNIFSFTVHFQLHCQRIAHHNQNSTEILAFLAWGECIKYLATSTSTHISIVK